VSLSDIANKPPVQPLSTKATAVILSALALGFYVSARDHYAQEAERNALPTVPADAKFTTTYAKAYCGNVSAGTMLTADNGNGQSINFICP
jgi:hypothetical protein